METKRPSARQDQRRKRAMSQPRDKSERQDQSGGKGDRRGGWKRKSSGASDQRIGADELSAGLESPPRPRLPQSICPDSPAGNTGAFPGASPLARMSALRGRMIVGRDAAR